MCHRLEKMIKIIYELTKYFAPHYLACKTMPSYRKIHSHLTAIHVAQALAVRKEPKVNMKDTVVFC